jgi:hypothetical protein
VPTSAARQIGFLSGNPRATEVTFVVASFTDAAILVEAFSTAARTGSPVASRTVNASAGGAPELAKYADDRGSNDAAGVTYACWVGTSSLTGLSAGTRYYLRLTQGAVVESDCETWTAPAAGSDFNVYFVSCDISYRQIGNDSNEPGPGPWPAIRGTQRDTGKAGFVVWIDDIGYSDGVGIYQFPVTEIPDDSGYSGKQMTGVASTTLLAYDYAITYLCLLGMLGNTEYSGVAWGREEARLQMLRTLPVAFQWGDHEFSDNLNLSAGAATSKAAWTPGKAAWDGLLGLLRPTPAGGDIRSADVTATHWALDLGDLRVIAPDGITRASGGSTSSWPYTHTAMYGSNQLNDVLTAAGSSHAFKVLAFGNTSDTIWKEDPPPTTSAGSYFSQGGLSLYVPAEWRRLMTNQGQTPPSLMDNPLTNGATGVTVFMHGDLHHPFVQRHYGWWNGNSKDTGLRCDIVSVNMAPGTREIREEHADAITAVKSGFTRGMQMHYIYPFFRATGDATFHRRPSCGHVRVEGTRSPKQMTVNLLGAPYGQEESWEVAWDGIFRVGSNRPLNRHCADRGWTA